MQQREIEATATLDDLVQVLRDLRLEAGSPSFTQIASTIARLRHERTGQQVGYGPGRVTVYDAFRTGRQRLNPELAADIVAALGRLDLVAAVRRAHARILRHRTLTPARPRVTTVPVADLAGPTPARGVSSSDSDTSSGVTGRRAADVAVLTAALLDPARPADRPTVAVLTGMPGVGKTTVARALAHDLARRLGTPSVLEVALRTASGDDERRSLPPRDVAREIATALRSARDVPAVLLLDDVPDDDALAALVDAVPPSACVVAVSRRRLHIPGATIRHEVDRLTAPDDVALLALLLAPHTTPDTPAADAAALRGLAERCGGLPLAITVLAGQAARTPGWYLSDHVRRLDTMAQGLAPAIDDAYDGLDQPARDVLCLLATHTGRLSAREIGVALLPGRSDAEARATALVRDLAREHLARIDDDDRVELHDVVRSTALRRAGAEVPRSAVVGQVSRLATDLTVRVLHVWGRTRASDGGPTPRVDLGELPPLAPGEVDDLPTGEDDLLAWLDRHTEVAVTTAQLAAEVDLPEDSLRLARAVSVPLMLRERYSDAYLALSAAADHPDSRLTEQDRVDLASATRLSGRFEEARGMIGALAASGATTGALRVELAWAEALTGSLERAVLDFEAVLEQEDPDSEHHLIAHRSLAQAYVLVGRPVEARAVSEEELAAAHGLVARNAPVAAINLARALRELDDLVAAEEATRRAIVTARKQGIERVASLAESVLVDVLLDLGRPAEALAVAEPAYAGALALEDPSLAVFTGCSLADAARACGDPARSTQVLAEVAESLRRFSYPAIEVDHLVASGRDLLARGDVAGALRALTSADTVADRSGLRMHQSRARLELGSAAAAASDPEAARSWWTSVVDAVHSSPYAVRVARDRLATL